MATTWGLRRVGVWLRSDVDEEGHETFCVVDEATAIEQLRLDPAVDLSSRLPPVVCPPNDELEQGGAANHLVVPDDFAAARQEKLDAMMRHDWWMPVVEELVRGNEDITRVIVSSRGALLKVVSQYGSDDSVYKILDLETGGDNDRKYVCEATSVLVGEKTIPVYFVTRVRVRAQGDSPASRIGHYFEGVLTGRPDWDVNYHAVSAGQLKALPNTGFVVAGEVDAITDVMSWAPPNHHDRLSRDLALDRHTVHDEAFRTYVPVEIKQGRHMKTYHTAWNQLQLLGGGVLLIGHRLLANKPPGSDVVLPDYTLQCTRRRPEVSRDEARSWRRVATGESTWRGGVLDGVWVKRGRARGAHACTVVEPHKFVCAQEHHVMPQENASEARLRVFGQWVFKHPILE